MFEPDTLSLLLTTRFAHPPLVLEPLGFTDLGLHPFLLWVLSLACAALLLGQRTAGRTRERQQTARIKKPA